MPSLEITLPQIDLEIRKTLARRLTEDFSQALGFPPDLLGIRFAEYRPEEVAVGGVLVLEAQGRNHVHLLLYSPRISREKKRKFGALVHRSFQQIFPDEGISPVIHICEHPYDNIVIEGELLSDKYEECRQSEFYYPLEKD